MKEQTAAAFRYGGCFCFIQGQCMEKKNTDPRKTHFYMQYPQEYMLKIIVLRYAYIRLKNKKKTKKLGGDRT